MTFPQNSFFGNVFPYPSEILPKTKMVRVVHMYIQMYSTGLIFSFVMEENSNFKESGKLLTKGKFLMLYGPFKIFNKHTSQSNYFFDNSLKMQNNLWGIRNLEKINEEAKKNDFFPEEIINMPANNFSIIYKKVSH